MKKNLSKFASVFAVLTAFFPCCLACATTYYSSIDLGTLGGTQGYANSINLQGQVVGHSTPSVGSYAHATLYDTTGNGNNKDLTRTSVYNCGTAYSINNTGQIVGYDGPTSTTKHATLFDPANPDNNRDLGTLGGNEGVAISISNTGHIVGWSNPAGSLAHCATLFDSSGDGTNIPLGTIPGFSWSQARSINSSGQIVGFAQVPSSATNLRAVLFDPADPDNNIDLGTLGGQGSQALSNNENGDIVGCAYTASGIRNATLFDPSGNGDNISLGILGGESSIARGINNMGQIVGQSDTDDGSVHAFIYEHGHMLDLNPLITNEEWISGNWILNQASAINDYGYIVGYGTNPAGEIHAFLLTPEPCTLLLLGLGGLAVLKRRR